MNLLGSIKQIPRTWTRGQIDLDDDIANRQAVPPVQTYLQFNHRCPKQCLPICMTLKDVLPARNPSLLLLP